jgi:hypothetical protein
MQTAGIDKEFFGAVQVNLNHEFSWIYTYDSYELKCQLFEFTCCEFSVNFCEFVWIYVNAVQIDPNRPAMVQIDPKSPGTVQIDPKSLHNMSLGWIQHLEAKLETHRKQSKQEIKLLFRVK